MPGHKFSKGHQKFGGRQKGGPRRKLDPQLKRRLQEFLDQGLRISPLDAMLGVLKLRIEEGDYEGALAAAAQAAPYCHAKLNATDIRVQHATDRSDTDITNEIAILRAKLDAARSLPAPPVTIDVPVEPEPEPVIVDRIAAGK
jgi:hypothetical protein